MARVLWHSSTLSPREEVYPAMRPEKNSDEVGPDLMAFNYVSHKVFVTVWHVGHSQPICHTAPFSAALLAMAISMGIFVTVIRVLKLQC